MQHKSSKYQMLVGFSALIGLGCAETATQPLAANTHPITPSILRGQIVYYEVADYYQIAIADSDGTRLKGLSPSGALDIDPAVSRDGTRIAFANAVPNTNDWNIFVMNADGSNRVRVTNLQWQNDRPAWSPDGKRIVFESNVDRRSNQIYVVDADGTGVTQLTFENGSSGSPEWSPD